MTHEQAKRAGQLLGVHWTTVYRLRKRFLPNPVSSSLVRKKPGSRAGTRALPADDVIDDVLSEWLPRQLELAHPTLDVQLEIEARCAALGLQAPSRSTIVRRFKAHRDVHSELLAADPASQVAPGSFVATRPLELVQIDHTQADVFVVDRFTRRTVGRPWLSLAIDLATRCVVGFFVGMERPRSESTRLNSSHVKRSRMPSSA